ncbi:helix-turn-helix domain-containing protein [Amycolatopsis umgeniensis]|uniref:DNA-binding transcriptional regulator GbsR (MarR family) n=1 Tax=Amycolatopsis umgeniensis TaxID=336628 RepID=A0A841B361_9PSEU|nr:helix-turn-helix domain-containing protein [Amycolatopsis umgeniensis]MBB5855489.1 DNA-binding transcriptional regulator GbsR (MarR family) [Amycolatopsis umgeniensis]
MPGGRLTLEDRRLIAAWLKDGHGYAEIARRLGRPTSTISREVSRNSGHSGYRAEEASRVTGERARRRSPSRSRTTPVVANGYGRDEEAVRAFEAEFAEMMVTTGLPRMTARVLACLAVTDSGVLTAAELTRRLQVSPASISNAVAYLETQGMLKRERDGRRELYVVDGEIPQRAWAASVRSNHDWVEVTYRGAELLGTATPAGTRMDDLARFYGRIHEAMVDTDIAIYVGDALTALAALLHAGRALSVSALSDALGWPAERVSAALRAAEEYPHIAGPVTVVVSGGGEYRAVPLVERLTAAQLEALGG